MEHIIHNLSLNMQSSISQVSLSVKKGDTMRKLCITLTDNGTVYRIAEGCEAVLSAKKESGWILYNNCTIDYENNIIVYEFTHGTAIMPGKLDCEIKLYDANKNLITSPQFTIIVNNSVHEDGEVEDSNEFSALTTLYSEVTTKLHNGEFIGAQGPQGVQGERGPAPVKGVDYFTEVDKADMVRDLASPFANAIKGAAEGKEVTVYDVSPVDHTAKAWVHGKNLLNSDLFGKWFEKQADGSYLSNTEGPATRLPLTLPKGVYTLSVMLKSPVDKNYRPTIVYADDTTEAFFKMSTGEYIQHTGVTNGKAVKALYFDYSSPSNAVQFKDFQIEQGDTITDYEAHIDPTTVTVTEEATGATYTPNADGTCEVVSASPTMTLSTDNADVTIECEYNRDISAVIADLSLRSRISYIDLLASKWQGTASPYSQVVAVEGATENSQVDLTPSVEQLSIFHNKDLAFVTENEDGVVTVYAIGQKPTNDYHIQVTITEVVR